MSPKYRPKTKERRLSSVVEWDLLEGGIAVGLNARGFGVVYMPAEDYARMKDEMLRKASEPLRRLFWR